MVEFLTVSLALDILCFIFRLRRMKLSSALVIHLKFISKICRVRGMHIMWKKKQKKTTSYHGASGGRKKSHSSQAIEDYET